VQKLETALRSFLGQDEPISLLAQILIRAAEKGSVSYGEIQGMAAGDWEDLLLLSNSWRLLVPWNKASRTIDWEDGVFLFETDEVYHIPNVVRHMAQRARETGEWDVAYAVSRAFKEMGDPDYELMPGLVELIGDQARGRRVDALQIKQACEQVGLGERVDPLIAELKASGVLCPKLSCLSEALALRCPVYELNPCLFAGKGSAGSGCMCVNQAAKQPYRA
jgi:hypothetical protein